MLNCGIKTHQWITLHINITSGQKVYNYHYFYSGLSSMNSFVNYGFYLHLPDCQSVTMPRIAPSLRTSIC